MNMAEIMKILRESHEQASALDYKALDWVYDARNKIRVALRCYEETQTQLVLVQHLIEKGEINRALAILKEINT